MNLKREKATGSSPVATNKTTIDCNTVFSLFKQRGAK